MGQLQLKLHLLLVPLAACARSKTGTPEQEKNASDGLGAAFTRPCRRPRSHRCSETLKAFLADAFSCNNEPEKEVQALCCLRQLSLLPECSAAPQPPVDTGEFTASAAPQHRFRKPPSSPPAFPSLSDDMIPKHKQSKARFGTSSKTMAAKDMMWLWGGGGRGVLLKTTTCLHPTSALSLRSLWPGRESEPLAI